MSFLPFPLLPYLWSAARVLIGSTEGAFRAQISGAHTVRVPVSRPNQALQRVNRRGGRVINVVVR